MAIELLPDTAPLEKIYVMLEHANKYHWFSLKTIKVTEKHTKSQYDWNLHPHVFHEGDLVLVYGQTYNILGWGKFKPLWRGPYIFKQCLGKGEYLLKGPKGELLLNPRNAVYLKKVYT